MQNFKLFTAMIYIMLGAAGGAAVTQVFVYSRTDSQECELHGQDQNYHKPLKNSPSKSF